MSSELHLDSRLKDDTLEVATLDLCLVRLAKNAAWPWLILVPQVDYAVEITDLTSADYIQLWAEVALASRALRAVVPEPDKINIAAIGNIVRQLHIHIVARYVGDAAWPRPIWGSGHEAVRDATAQASLIADLQSYLKTA